MAPWETKMKARTHPSLSPVNSMLAALDTAIKEETQNTHTLREEIKSSSPTVDMIIYKENSSKFTHVHRQNLAELRAITAGLRVQRSDTKASGFSPRQQRTTGI